MHPHEKILSLVRFSNLEDTSPDSADGAMSLASDMVEMNTVYRFRLTYTSGSFMSTNGAGVIAGYDNADPSGGTGSTWTASEYSSLAALFSQIRVIGYQVWFTPVNPNSTVINSNSNGVQGIFIASVLSSLAGAPSTAGQVLDNADCKEWCCFTTAQPHPYVHNVRYTGNINWASINTPNPGSYAGCPGAIQWYGGGFQNAEAVFRISHVGIYEFRSRI